jgi:DegV family protein with EDD domain
MFVPGTLEYLHKGGRIGRAAALLGGILQIRPVLHLVGGKVDVLDKVRTQQRALARMVEELTTHRHLEYIGVVHITAPDKAEQLAADVSGRYPDTPISVSKAGSVLGAHLGPGLVAIIYQDKVPE